MRRRTRAGRARDVRWPDRARCFGVPTAATNPQRNPVWKNRSGNGRRKGVKDNPMVEEVLEELWTAVEEEGLDPVPLARLGLAHEHLLLAEMVELGLRRH